MNLVNPIPLLDIPVYNIENLTALHIKINMINKSSFFNQEIKILIYVQVWTTAIYKEKQIGASVQGIAMIDIINYRPITRTVMK